MFKTLKTALFFSLLFFTLLPKSKAQNAAQSGQKKSGSALMEKYQRVSLTYCLLDVSGEKYMWQLKNNFNKVKVNDKFNDHSLMQPYILASPYSRSDNFADKNEQIRQALMKREIGKAVIAKWFSQKADGSFSMDLIAQRGTYNATDADVRNANAAKRGTAELQDAGESLIKQSYIVVYDFNNVETWDEYYDRIDERNRSIARQTKTKPVSTPRIYYGYRGEATAYLYRVAWNDSLAAVFYNQAWNNPAVFNKMQFPLTFVSQVYVDGIKGAEMQVDRSRSDDELMALLEQNATERSLDGFARENESFKVRTMVFSKRPLTAKIGKKEDVKIDQRYFVYEIGLDNKGNKTATRKAVIRATKHITDNRSDATGETQPTRFYQESGKRIYPGMVMEQNDDYGVGFSFGWAQRSLQGPAIRLEYNLARIVNVSMLKIYIEGQVGFGSVKFGNSNTSMNAVSYSLGAGISKEYCLLKNIHIEPFVGIQYDTSSAKFNDSDKAAIKSAGLTTGKAMFGAVFGLRIPINITYNLQLLPSVSVSTINYSSEKSVYGSKLPSSLHSFAGNTTDGADNPNANLNKYRIKWEVSLRYKF